MEEIERYRGAMLGLAIGDSLGTALEFKAPGSFEPVTGIIGGGPFNLSAGEWTDDTSMALCLAESLIETNGFQMSLIYFLQALIYEVLIIHHRIITVVVRV